MTAPAKQYGYGFTLIECMIALTLGMLVIAAATALLLSAQQTYLAIDDSARIDDAGASALAALGAAIRQAAYADRGSEAAPPKPPGNALFGIDNAALMARSATFDQRSVASRNGVNGSDVLATRFMATDIFGTTDRNMLNCAGHPITNSTAKPAIPSNAEDVYNWSIFYIARDSSGEPELFCKYRAKNNNFAADAIARGVEAMQFLYGVDLDGDGLPDTFLQANAIASNWPKVVAVSIALSVRGATSLPSPRSPSSQSPQSSAVPASAADVHHLFGAAYSAQYAAGDPGVRLDMTRFRPAERNRSRRILRSIVMLRNIHRGGER